MFDSMSAFLFVYPKSWDGIRADIDDATSVFQELQTDSLLTQSQRDTLIETPKKHRPKHLRALLPAVMGHLRLQ